MPLNAPAMAVVPRENDDDAGEIAIAVTDRHRQPSSTFAGRMRRVALCSVASQAESNSSSMWNAKLTVVRRAQSV
jgi:hypothetical protein